MGRLSLRSSTTDVAAMPSLPTRRASDLLRHAPGGVEDKIWKEVRVKDELNFGGESYNIVAITANEVVLSAKSNKKRSEEHTSELQSPSKLVCRLLLDK